MRFIQLIVYPILYVFALSGNINGPKNGPKNNNIKNAKSASAPPPRRITSASTKSGGLSLRTQLKLVRKVKQQESTAKTILPKGTTKVINKKKKTEDETESDGNDYVSEILYDKPLLLVDGYNVIFGNKALSELSADVGLEPARRQLVSDCGRLATIRGWEATVVFDGREDGSEEFTDDQVCVIFARGLDSADAVIERQAVERRVLGNGATIVATNDNLIRLIASASNANLLSVDQLTNELHGAKRAISNLLVARQRANAVSVLTESVHSPSTTILNASTETLSFETALRNKLLGDQALAREAATQRRRQSLKDGLKSILARLDAAGLDHRDPNDLRTLHDIETTILPRFNGLDTWLRHQKQLFGLLDLMHSDWWTQIEQRFPPPHPSSVATSPDTQQ